MRRHKTMYLRCRDDSAGVYRVHEAQYRRVWEQQQAEERCKEILEQIHTESATASLPHDLVEQVEKILKKNPTLSWDKAVAEVLGKDSAPGR